MSIEIKRHFWVWGLFFLVGVLLLILVSGVLLPFVAGMAVAYFLDPLADKIETVGLSRSIATILITLVFFAIAIAALILLFPLLQNQILEFFSKLPQLIHKIENWLGPFKELIWKNQDY